MSRGEVEASLEGLAGPPPYSRGSLQRVSPGYRRFHLLSDDDRKGLAHEYVNALLLEGIRTQRGMRLLFCVCDILALDACSQSRVYGIVGGIGDVVQEYLEHGGRVDRVEEWWACVCSSMVSAVVSLSSLQDGALAEWMFALFLSLSRSTAVVECDEKLVSSVFGTTFGAVSDMCCETQPLMLYRLVHAGIQEMSDACISGSVLFACLSAILVSLRKNSSGVEYHSIARELWYQHSRHAVLNTGEAVACGLALHHVYHDGSLRDTKYSSQCILRASISVLCGAGDETVCMTLPRHMLDILARHPPLSMQIWVLEEIKLQIMQRINTIQSGQDVFDFATRVVDRSTRGMTVMHPSAPALIIDILSLLNPWRPPRTSHLFERIVRCLIEILDRFPEYAEPVIHDSLQRMCADMTRESSRIHLVLSILLPCCHRLESSWIIDPLGPFCLSLIQDSVHHTSLAFVVNDMCCSMIAHPGLSPEHVHKIASTYITACLDVLSSHHDTPPPLMEYFTIGFMTIIQHCPDSSITYLDTVLDACTRLVDNHTALFGLVQAAAYSLDAIPLESLPKACDRFRGLFTVLKKTSLEAYHGCRGRVLEVVQTSQDITRLPYLAQQFSYMVHA